MLAAPNHTQVHTLKIGNAAQKADDAVVLDVVPGFTPGGLSRLAFAQQATGAAPNLAFLTSTLDNWVGVLDLATLSVTKVQLPSAPDGNTTSASGHGASRELLVAQASDGRLHALVAASRMGWLHVLGVGKVGSAVSATFVAATLEAMDAKRMVFCPKVAGPSAGALASMPAFMPGSSRSSSSYESVAVAALVIGIAALVLSAAGMALMVARARAVGGVQLPCAGAAACVKGSDGEYVRHVDAKGHLTHELTGKHGGF